MNFRREKNPPSLNVSYTRSYIVRALSTSVICKFIRVSTQFSQTFSFVSLISSIDITRDHQTVPRNGIIRKFSKMTKALKMNIFSFFSPLSSKYLFQFVIDEEERGERKKNAGDTYRIYASSTYTPSPPSTYSSFIPRVFTTHPFASRQKTINTPRRYIKS